jgi:hypothetical protein
VGPQVLDRDTDKLAVAPQGCRDGGPRHEPAVDVSEQWLGGREVGSGLPEAGEQLYRATCAPSGANEEHVPEVEPICLHALDVEADPPVMEKHILS